MNHQNITACLRGLSNQAYQVFGAHFSHEYDQDGVRFTVYAPNAQKVSLIGDFNQWSGYDLFRSDDGVWSIFAANIPEGSLYKYRITTLSGEIHDRMDPFAYWNEVRPNTASIVYSLDGYCWNDQAWMAKRNKNFNAPLNIYEIHAGSWKIPGEDRFYTYTQLAEHLIPYVKQNGYTHIEFLPLTEHPFDGSWGYQPTGYFSPTSRYGTPKQLMELIDRCHQAGIGVILDFVPVHFVKDFYALHQYDGGYLYESQFDDRRFSQWDTALFDYTKPYVLSFMESALEFWVQYYHIDGIRYDAVANLIYPHGAPENGVNEPGIWFLKQANFALAQNHPDVMLIAEDSSNYLKVTAPVVYGGLGFDYKWNLGWMHDILEYMALPPEQRASHHHLLTFSITYFYQEIYLLPFSHDEVVHGKKTIIDKIWGNYEEKFQQLRLLYVYMFTHPGKKLNFMGNELAEFKEWSEAKELGWNLLEFPAHDCFFQFFRNLCCLYQELSPLYAQDYHPDSFHWIDVNNASQNLLAYKRIDGNKTIYVVLNFSSRPIYGYRLRVEQPGTYREILNTDAVSFGGSGLVNDSLFSHSNAMGNEIHLAIGAYSGIILEKTEEETTSTSNDALM
ncbi:MAG: 1,4-alpha-glucan branching protein GlgB [Massiliimalia sp.]